MQKTVENHYMNDKKSEPSVRENFYFYIKCVGSNDRLYPLESIALRTQSSIKINSDFLANLKLTMEAATVPIYVAIEAGSSARHALIKFLLESGEKGDIANLNASMLLLKSTSMLDSLIPTFENLNGHQILSQHFETLYKALAIQFYSYIEDLSKQILKAILIKNITLLDHLGARGLKIKKSDCKKLKARIDQERSENKLTLDEAYDEIILNKGYLFEQHHKIFEELVGLNLPQQQLVCLKNLESSRHLFVHRNSIIDQKFISETGTTQLSGTTLGVNAQMMYEWEKAVIGYAHLLLQASDPYCI